MRVTRRNFIATGALMGAAVASGRAAANSRGDAHRADSVRTQLPHSADGYRPVVTLNGWTLPWRQHGAWKEFHLVAEPVAREIAPGLVAHLWGYNGQSPGPTIECVEGDKVRVFVTNALPEPTTMHWQGLPLTNGMAGIEGLTQPAIAPGQTFAYAFEMTRSGTFLYRPQADARAQAALGLIGAIVVHPRDRALHPADRDYVVLLNAYDLAPHRTRPEIATPLWTLNGRSFPGIDPLVARTGERVRVRAANFAAAGLSLHLQGHAFTVTATGGGWIPESARWPDTVLDLPAGALRVLEFTADAEGDWALHCPRPGRNARATGIEAKIRTHTSLGETPGVPVAAGFGPFGPLAMGPMLTLVKVRTDLAAGDGHDPGWYRHPAGTRAKEAGAVRDAPARRMHAASGRHLEVKVAKPRDRA